MGSKLFYIIRHGETEFNKLGIVQGSGVDMPLNERGMAQAQKFYTAYRNAGFKKIYTSALTRTQQSVWPFIQAGIPHIAKPELNEISWGIFEGKPQSREEREEYGHVVRSWNSGQYEAKISGGESAMELQKRQIDFIHYLKHEEEDSCILIAMHGRAMKSFLCTFLDRPLTDMDRYEHSNLCLYVIEFDGRQSRLLRQNDTLHLL